MTKLAAAENATVVLPPGLEPRWERRFSGRFRYELDALRSVGVTPEVDTSALEAGRLEITFEWQLADGTRLRLRAAYPDAFPHMRPQVFLVSGLADPPTRHCSPIEGNLCLLGRDTRQWMPSWTLAKLLSEQLEDALRGTGEEDPQGEPADFWWNSLGARGAACLVDSRWDLGAATGGTLRLRYIAQIGSAGSAARRVPIIRAVVLEVRNSANAVIARWDGPLPPDLAEAKAHVTVPWARLPETIFPAPDLAGQVNAVRGAHDTLRNARPQPIGGGMAADFFALAHPVEVAHNETGLGWVLFQVSGQRDAFAAGGKRKRRPPPRIITTIPVFRAGPTDLGHRVPAVSLLREKRVAVVGIGAVGAPVAVELARNGCGTLRLVEHDVVEPGNTVRWPLGASAWGQPKLEALKAFLGREYPATLVHNHPHFLGHAGNPDAGIPGDDDVLDAVLPHVDLVIDASASHGVTTLLADRCRERGLPMISLFATPTLEGGAVVRHAGSGGCPNCLLHAWHNGEIKPPPGNGDDAGLSQPPGCAERTFIGAGYDLQELSLQTMRLAVQTLSEPEASASLIQTLSFVDEDGRRMPPKWQVDELSKHPGCHCRPDE